MEFTCSLHTLSTRLIDASSSIPAPLSAAQRIEHRPFMQMMKSQWNSQVEALFQSVGGFNSKAVDWSKRTLYGGYVNSKKE